MDKIFNWVKNHKKSIILILLGLFFIPMIIIHFLFKWNSNIYLIQADWESGDVLGYIGNFYGLLSTVIFSMLALWQNHIIEKKNQEYNKKVQEVEAKLNMPIFDIPNSEQGCNGLYANFRFKLRNISPNPAIHVCISNFKIYDENKTEIQSSSSVNTSDTVLFAQSSIEVNFCNEALKVQNLTLIFFIEYKDKYYNKHKIKATGQIENPLKFKSVIFDLIEQEVISNANT